MNDYKWAFGIFAINFAGFGAMSVAGYFFFNDITYLTAQLPIYFFSCATTAAIGLVVVKADKAIKKRKEFLRRESDPFDTREIPIGMGKPS